MAFPSLLEDAPGSWMRQLIKTVDWNDRQALFRTSRRVARHVTSSSSTRLHFDHSRAPRSWYRAFRWGSMPLARYVGSFLEWLYAPFASAVTDSLSDVDKAGAVISQLLDGVVNVAVRMALHQGPQPLALALFPQVSSLHIYGENVDPPYDKKPPACTWLQLHGLSNIKEVNISGRIGGDVVACLCEALEAGHMPFLQKFKDYRGCKQPLPLQQRLSCALAKTIKDLTCIFDAYIDYLEHFMQLHNLDLCCQSMSDKAMRVLCDHPNLHTVCMKACSRAQPNFSQYKCTRWNTLLVGSTTNLQVLPSYPLAELQAIKIRWSVIWPEIADVAALPRLLEHSHKLVCEPNPSSRDIPVFCFTGLKPACAPLLQLARYLSSTEGPLLLLLSSRQDTSTDLSPSLIVKALWQYIPSFVVQVRIEDDNDGLLRGDEVWENMPSHVTYVELRFRCQDNLPEEALRSIVAKVPSHVTALVLDFWNLGGTAIHADNDLALQLKALAPGHVRLEVM